MSNCGEGQMQNWEKVMWQGASTANGMAATDLRGALELE